MFRPLPDCMHRCLCPQIQQQAAASAGKSAPTGLGASFSPAPKPAATLATQAARAAAATSPAAFKSPFRPPPRAPATRLAAGTIRTAAAPGSLRAGSSGLPASPAAGLAGARGVGAAGAAAGSTFALYETVNIQRNVARTLTDQVRAVTWCALRCCGGCCVLLLQQSVRHCGLVQAHGDASRSCAAAAAACLDVAVQWHGSA